MPNHVYEICFRTRKDLPFATLMLMRLLLEGIVARVQRVHRIDICHDTWMGNHLHLLAVVRDALRCRDFYQEVQKKVTDTFKRLLGVPHLNLWEESPAAILQVEVEDVIKKIAYIYSNPTTANLVNTIDEYPGISTWKEFIGTDLGNLSAKIEKMCPWIQLPMIPTLKSFTVPKRQDEFYVEKMKKEAKKYHKLLIEPNAWMKCFGITNSKEVREINESIIARVRESEAMSRKLREAEGKRVIGAERLKAQPIMKSHTPKKKGIKVFVQTMNNEARMRVIAEFKAFCEECAACYERWKIGDFTVQWPPGAFLPPAPPIANALYC